MTDQVQSELEIKLTYQEDLVNQLNDIVSLQTIQIQKLTKRIDCLEKELFRLIKTDTLEKDNKDELYEIPPHY